MPQFYKDFKTSNKVINLIEQTCLVCDHKHIRHHKSYCAHKNRKTEFNYFKKLQTPIIGYLPGCPIYER
jgi:hypothetical protein